VLIRAGRIESIIVEGEHEINTARAIPREKEGIERGQSRHMVKIAIAKRSDEKSDTKRSISDGKSIVGAAGIQTHNTTAQIQTTRIHGERSTGRNITERNRGGTEMTTMAALDQCHHQHNTISLR
jgi:hypothetical protein